MRRRLPRDVKKLLVEALVFPYIRYCMAVWCGCTATQLKRIQKCINYGVRIVMDLAYRDRVSAALNELGWPKIESFVADHDVQIIYKLLNDANAPVSIRRLLSDRSEVSRRTTRATRNRELVVPRVRAEFARRSFL